MLLTVGTHAGKSTSKTYLLVYVEVRGQLGGVSSPSIMWVIRVKLRSASAFTPSHPPPYGVVLKNNAFGPDEMAQRVKCLLCKPGDPSSISGTHIKVEERESAPQSGFGTFTAVACLSLHSHLTQSWYMRKWKYANKAMVPSS